ncbi:MAG: DUF4160 domain-containing protein [Bacteroidia bacterium]|nr:DUF4160 domain-containing protein [Bacteroidia bacterium]
MPVVYNEKGFIFRFFSSDKNEPVHIHIYKGDGYAKIWLEPEINWAFSYGFKKKQRRDIFKIVTINKKLFINKWHEYFKK